MFQQTLKATSFIFLVLIFSISAVCLSFNTEPNDSILRFEVNLAEQEIKMYLKAEDGTHFNSLGSLKKHLESKGEQLLFAMNGGMYMEDRNPLGLYIEEGEVVRSLNMRKNATGNFYLEPNGVFYITKDQQATVVTTDQFTLSENINYATQSGPMLLIDGSYHPAFNQGSSNLNIRNGVGILPNGNVLFALSKKPINLYDFASFFKDQGCLNALYLDGFVSRAYLPAEDWEQLDGNFGVIIGVCE